MDLYSLLEIWKYRFEIIITRYLKLMVFCVLAIDSSSLTRNLGNKIGEYKSGVGHSPTKALQ